MRSLQPKDFIPIIVWVFNFFDIIYPDAAFAASGFFVDF